MPDSVPSRPPSYPATPPEHAAYFAHDAETYVCWDCATPAERGDRVPDGDAAGEQCERCKNWWEYADA